MIDVNKENIQQYLQDVFKAPISNVQIQKLGQGCVGTGYALDFNVNCTPERKILKTLFTSNLGMDHFSDRAGSLLLANSHYAKIPNHINSFDVCGVHEDGTVISVGKAQEFFLLLDEAHGKDLFGDFERIATTNLLTELDKKRILLLSDFLAKLHQDKPTKNQDSLYKRCIRGLIGGNTSIMSIIDMYPPHLNWVTHEQLQHMIQESIHYWTTHKFKHSRLCHVHGDFHPGNIWFKERTEEYTLLDRSGQTYGEAADDLTAFSINFIFYSLSKRGKFEGACKEGFELFWDNYLTKTKDQEILSVSPPFFALRSMVVCNPIFYSDDFFGSAENAKQTRQKIFNGALSILTAREVNLKKIEHYFR